MTTYRHGTSFWLALAAIPLGLLMSAFILTGSLAAAWVMAALILVLAIVAFALFVTGR